MKLYRLVVLYAVVNGKLNDIIVILKKCTKEVQV